jgi:hypothetical protein
MKNLLNRLLFVFLSTTIMVFFSEKAYWYTQGYALGELILFYAFPVFAGLWAIERFRVDRLAPLVLISGLFAFLVEGVLTNVIYEAGLLDPIMPAYFIGWHGLLSVVFGWVLIRQWLVQGQWQRILFGATAFGLFWGAWSLTFWLPENINDPDTIAHVLETGVPAGQWPVSDFALYTFTFTVVLMLAHWLLGRGFWPREFKPGRIETGIFFGALALYFAVNVLWANPLALFKMAALLGVILWGLRFSTRIQSSHNIYEKLAGRVTSTQLAGLLAMPVAATGVYALAAALPLSEAFIRTWLFEMLPPLQTLVGGVVFLWALAVTFRSARTQARQEVRTFSPDELVSR